MDDADAWRLHAPELAVVVFDTLVVDSHHWCAVRRPQERSKGKLLMERSGNLTVATVARHLEARAVQDLLVICGYAVIPDYHAVGGFGWIGFRVAPSSLKPEAERRAISWAQTQELAARLTGLGLSILVEHADGNGTYHVWIVLRREGGFAEWEEIKEIRAEEFVRSLLADLELDSDVFSPWLPLPGRHHTREWWSQFWRGGQWLRGEDAVAVLRSMPTNTVTLVRELCARYPVGASRQSRER